MGETMQDRCRTYLIVETLLHVLDADDAAVRNCIRFAEV